MLNVRLTPDELVELITVEARGLPAPIQHNIQHKQWEYMDTNLYNLSAKIEKIRRLLSAAL